MSLTVFVSPLHRLAGDGGLAWTAALPFGYGLPDEPPVPRPLPTVVEVLAAFQAAGCHGIACFKVDNVDPALRLTPCPEPGTCDGFDLGEVSLHGELGTTDDEVLSPDFSVDTVAFRQPSGRALLAAARALATAAGPLAVYGDPGERVFVVSPDDDPDRQAGNWPW